MVPYIFVVLALPTIEALSAKTIIKNCTQGLIKGECYKAVGGAFLETLLVNDRDGSSGYVIDWSNYHSYLRHLTCRCAASAYEKGFRTIGVQYYGECWGSRREIKDFYSHLQFDKTCINTNYEPCVPTDYMCSGSGGSTYLYEMATIKVSRDGNYGEWSGWSLCSKMCNGVQTRTRKCDNPTPLGLGKTCDVLGPAEETRDCNKDKCSELTSAGCSSAFKFGDVEMVNASEPSGYCRVLMPPKAISDQNYMVMGSFLNVDSDKGAGEGQAGIMFNFKDMNNFQFILLRLNSNTCYSAGAMINGVVQTSGPYSKTATCAMKLPGGPNYNFVTVSIRQGNVILEGAGTPLLKVQSITPSIGRGGFIVPNGRKNIVHFKGLMIM